MQPEAWPPASDAAEPWLSVAAAARRLGVAPATLRTWDRRYGIGPTEHTPGRHRRYSTEDLARLELMQRALVRGVSPADAAAYAMSAVRSPAGARLAAVAGNGGAPARPSHGHSGRDDNDSSVNGCDDGSNGSSNDGNGDNGNGDGRVRVGGRVLRLPGAGRAARGLGRAALALDAPTVYRLLEEAVATAGAESAWDDVVRPVLAAIGARWAHNGTGVEIEHLVSECVHPVFGARAAALRPTAPDARPILLGAMPGELHTLPLVALSAALAERGVVCRGLGANVPLEALVAAIRRTAPVAVVLWAQQPGTADADVLESLPRTRPRFRTFVAGPGWDDVELPERTAHLPSLRAATATISDAVLV
ncbi:MerR family transcriptional regulator [Pseudonocardia alaniniphila]|uniref:Cobalamin B12-binding domain-containing protein n=1 Tax=Pseudonocardia alaniniphila TaxID=75291 RepID=A0ABS9TFJ0_9PSEU|nr:MerR family transcriptional regulator [Pseudonocardia alaniniphila]MCH6167253.1 cobalamin B12-binding domain-containing protein [Pseudonocardia alaniniphila]